MGSRSAQEEAVAAVLARRGDLGGARAFAEAALDALGGGDVEAAAVDRLVAHARRRPGEEDCEADQDDHGALAAAAAARGGEVWLALRLGWLRAALSEPRRSRGRLPGRKTRSAEQADGIRELYGELLEEHRGQAAALARIREVGRLIDEAVERGDLPRALIRRAPR